MENAQTPAPEQAPEREDAATKKTKKRPSKEDFEALEKNLAETKDQLLRTCAEYDNFRKRTQKEREALFGDAKADALTKLLPVLDNFERAAQNTEGTYEDYRKGIDMIVGQLFEVMKSMQVEPFGEAGDSFDPNCHSAVMHIEDEQYGENTIVDVFQRGYRMGERILRPATVRVAN